MNDKNEKPQKLTRAHKIALSIISLACCCVIGISAFALVAPDAVEQLTAQQPEAAQNQEGDEQSQDETANDQEAAEENADGNETSQGDASQSGDNSSSSSANTSNNSSGKSSSSNGNSNAKGGSSGSASSNKSNDSGSTSSSGSSQNSQSAASSSNTVTVSVSVSSSAADGRVSGSAHPTFKKGATAYDALCATGLSISTKNSQYGIYVSAIGGLAEFEYGGKSGWMYSVNGSAPNVSCSSYKLKDGDVVSWYYVK